MTNERIKELYNNMLYHIGNLVGGNDLVNTLRAIGFTDKFNEWHNKGSKALDNSGKEVI